MTLRFSIKTLFVLITAVAITVWLNDDGFRELERVSSAAHGTVIIFGKKDGNTKEFQLRIRYRAAGVPGSEATFDSAPMLLPDSVGEFPAFASAVDQGTGIWCIHDNENAEFVMLVQPSMIKGVPGEFWHPGIHLGWMRGYWASLYTKIHQSNPQLPYSQLPSEYMLAD